MDAAGYHFHELGQEIRRKLPDEYSNLEFTPTIVVTTVIVTLSVVFILWYILSKIKSKVLPRHDVAKPRFRKRDKVLFYGRKMLRNVSSKVNLMSGGKANRFKKRQVVLKLAKRLLRMKKDSEPTLQVKEPPPSFLEADGSDKKTDSRLPPEVLYMLRSVRVLGHFEKPLFWELCRYMETMPVAAGQYLFKVGELDDSIFVVQNGCIDVFVTESDGVDYLMKKVCTGDSIHSLLSLLDVLTGHPAPYKTVSAKAATDSIVLRLPAIAFQELFTRYPESLVRVVQIITVRLQRVTLMALHNYLGLSSELIKPHIRITRSLSIHQVVVKGDKRRESTDSRRDSTPDQLAPKTKVPIVTSPIVANEETTSDFEAACLRARVHSTQSVEKGVAAANLKTDDDRYERRPSRLESDRRDSKDTTTSDADILEFARRDLVTIFKLKDPSLLDNRLHVRKYGAGSVLMKQGDQDCNLYYVVSGRLRSIQLSVNEGCKETHLFKVHPGELVGTLAVLTGEPSFFTIQAKVDSIVVAISKTDFYKVMRKQPSIVLDVAHTIVQRMSPFTRQIDFALDWNLVEAGCALYRQGDKGDCSYIILTGRLRSVITLIDGKKEMVGEYGRGEIVGIVETLTLTARATTVIAVRDTEVAAIPSELVNLIKRKYPQVVTRLIHLLGKKILGNLQTRNVSAISEHVNVEGKHTVANLSTIALVPISRDVPLTNFALDLKHALSAICKTAYLQSDVVKTRLGVSALESVNEFRLYNWLGQQEDDNDMVLYQCDDSLTKWTHNCIRQADCILIVGLADREPGVLGDIESKLENVAVRAQKELVLLHRETATAPNRTVEWLNARGWVSRFHHIQCPSRVFRVHPHSRVKMTYQKLNETTPDRNSDFSRLARTLTGTSIGIVLGGGGARGISQVGIIRALMEAGVPIDMVGGTSIGSLVGAVWCDTRNLAAFNHRVREYSMEMTSLWKKIFDLTYPITSMFTGAAFNALIEQTFKDRQVEDLWIPYFCISTDITASKMRVHTNGSLWRYVRSSMSLAGYLPPLCDPIDGHLLVDGAYVNNLPADVMRSMGVGHIFAVDVGSRDDSDLTNYGDELSGWWLLWKRWNPWTTPVKVPDMNDIQSRLAYVSSERQLEIVRNSDWCEYIRPPIDKYRTLQFGAHDEINAWFRAMNIGLATNAFFNIPVLRDAKTNVWKQVGYDHGRTMLEAWSKGGLIDKLFQKTDVKPIPDQNSEFTFPPMANFTDLAELVSKIESPAIRSHTDGGFFGRQFEAGSTTEDMESDLCDDDEYIDDDDAGSEDSQKSRDTCVMSDNMPSPIPEEKELESSGN